MSNTVYVLSATYGSPSHPLMYMNKDHTIDNDMIATVRLGQAMTFASEDEARSQRIRMNDSGWQIQPTTMQKIFQARLKGI